MRLPNGYGSVAKLSGQRRKPYVARKSNGFDDRGYPIYCVIGYFETRELGLMALSDYNKNPYDLDRAKITLEELFTRYLESAAAKKLSDGSIKAMKSSLGHCKAIHNTPYKDIKAHHMQACVDNCGCGYATQGAIRTLFINLDKYALSLDIITAQHSNLIITESIPETKKKPFTDDEVKRLWDMYNNGNRDAELPLILIYTGWRISELMALRREDVDITALTMKGGTKTKAGKDRIVPINGEILPIIKKRLDDGGKKLINCSLPTFRSRWDTLETGHTPHEARHTLRSKLDSMGANKVCIDRIMGHASKDVGERVYTHKTLKELRDTIELVKYR